MNVQRKGGDLHASHRALRENYIINWRPHAISAFDNIIDAVRVTSPPANIQCNNSKYLTESFLFVCQQCACS